MSNLSNVVSLFTHKIDKNGINEESLIGIIEQDEDFSGELCQRISKDIFDRHKDELEEDELEALIVMINELIDVDGFIGTSSAYGDYSLEIIETEFQYVVVIAVIV